MTARQRPIESLHIPEGRFIDAAGATVLVQPALPNERLRPGRVAYDQALHYQRLKCPHCDVRVDFNKGAGVASCGVSLIGARPHFKKAPKQDHGKECELPKLTHAASDSLIDNEAGYRLHLNAVFTTYGKQQQIYRRGADGRVIADDSRLQPGKKEVDDGNGGTKTVKVYRESVAVHNVQEIIDVMRRGQLHRLRDSLVVNNTVLEWEKFAILNKERMRNLVDRLCNGASHPVLMRVGVYAPAEGTAAQSEKVFYFRDDKGPHFIVPNIFLDGPGTEACFPTKGEYLVLGLPRLAYDKKSGSYMLNLSLKSPDFAAQYFKSDIIAEGVQRDAKRKAALPALAPSL